MTDEDRIYQRIGEFAVSFQWIESRLREIGWFVLDPDRTNWPPTELRNLTNKKLVERVHQLFLQALPQCKLHPDLEAELRESFESAVVAMHGLRRARNRILHSAYVELKAGGVVQGLLRSNPKIEVDAETGHALFDQELLSLESLSKEMKAMGELAMFLNRAYTQLNHRYRSDGA